MKFLKTNVYRLFKDKDGKEPIKKNDPIDPKHPRYKDLQEAGLLTDKPDNAIVVEKEISDKKSQDKINKLEEDNKALAEQLKSITEEKTKLEEDNKALAEQVAAKNK